LKGALDPTERHPVLDFEFDQSVPHDLDSSTAALENRHPSPSHLASRHRSPFGRPLRRGRPRVSAGRAERGLFAEGARL
jgi:hypothetical protein